MLQIKVGIRKGNVEDLSDLELLDATSDLTDYREFGRRLNAGSIVLNQVVNQGQYDSWWVELVRAWAKVDDKTVLKATIEDWTPWQVRDILQLDVDIPLPSEEHPYRNHQ